VSCGLQIFPNPECADLDMSFEVSGIDAEGAVAVGDQVTIDYQTSGISA